MATSSPDPEDAIVQQQARLIEVICRFRPEKAERLARDLRRR